MKIWVLFCGFVSMCFATPTQHLNFNLGYRYDHLTQKGDANITTQNGLITFFDRTLRDLNLLQLEAAFFICFNEGFFFRGNVGYGWILSNPKIAYHHHVGQQHIDGMTSVDRHKYALDLLGAIGWLWQLSPMTQLGPELGFAFAKLTIDKGNSLHNTLPFLGVQLYANFGDYFFSNVGLDYYFLGRRKEYIQLFNGQKLHSIHKGFVHGPQCLLSIGYRLNSQWAFNCNASLRYLMTNKEKDVMLREWLKLKTTWLMCQLLVGITYIF
ncbi:MAG: hypothetical protein K940chlam8_00937 [Chlamydiae bacterium]|nr:hypothetical protein [Chlamydiota bacterium]